MFRSMLCGVAAYILMMAGLNSMGLVGPDEPRYADVARGMHTSGDYITPRLFGESWFEKPPLYYWLAATAFHLGVSEFAARLPSALFALMFLGVWYWFARRFRGERAAQWSCLILATSLGWIGFSRAAAMDMLLTTTLSASLAFFAVWWLGDAANTPSQQNIAHHHAKRPTWALYAFYAILALATLAKGPLAVGLAGLVVLACILHCRDWPLIRQMLITPAVALYGLIALPWYVLCYMQNGWPFIEEFFIRHNLQRFTSGEIIGHPQPGWFYFSVLPAAIYPWTPLLLIASLWGLVLAIRGGGRSIGSDPRLALLLYWVALPFIFFSLAENKLPGYLLPLLPPLSLLLAGTLVDSDHGESSPQSAMPAAWRKTAVSLTAATLLLVPLFSWVLPETLATGLTDAIQQAGHLGWWSSITHSGIPLQLWGVVILLIAGAIVLAWRGLLLEAGGTIGLAVCACLLGLLIYLTPVVNGIASVRNVADRAVSLGIEPTQMGVLYLHRTQVYGLGFYLGGGLKDWDPDNPADNFPFIAARDDFHVDEMRPGARSLAIFPLQHLRLWALPVSGAEAQPASAALHRQPTRVGTRVESDVF